MRPLLFILLAIPSIATAQSFPIIQGLQRLPVLPPLQPQIAPVQPIAPQGYAVYERERPLPPQWGVDSYKSYKVIPLDKYGQPTQPLVTLDEFLQDMVWGSLHKKEND